MNSIIATEPPNASGAYSPQTRIELLKLFAYMCITSPFSDDLLCKPIFDTVDSFQSCHSWNVLAMNRAVFLLIRMRRCMIEPACIQTVSPVVVVCATVRSG